MISGHTTFFSRRENLVFWACKDNEIVVHANEEGAALVWVGMWSDSQEIVLAFVGRDLRNGELAGFAIAGTALNAVIIEDVTVVTEKVDTSTNHADKESLAIILTADDSEEFFGAVDFLSSCWRKSEGNES